MLCHLTRWMISRELDKGKKMPRFADLHTGRCDACRAYARFAESLPARFSREIPAFLAEVPDFPPDRIPPFIKNEPRRIESGPRRRFIFRPVPATAAILAVVVGGIIFFRVLPGNPEPTAAEMKAALADLKYVTEVSNEFRGAVVNAESSMDREYRILEKSVRGAFEYLQAGLNIKIERKKSPQSS